MKIRREIHLRRSLQAFGVCNVSRGDAIFARSADSAGGEAARSAQGGTDSRNIRINKRQETRDKARRIFRYEISRVIPSRN